MNNNFKLQLILMKWILTIRCLYSILKGSEQIWQLMTEKDFFDFSILEWTLWKNFFVKDTLYIVKNSLSSINIVPEDTWPYN